jgi:hypothetical protein
MTIQDFSVSFQTDRSAEEVFNAVKDVRAWWTENTKGSSKNLNDEFEVQFGDVHYSRQKIVELIPGKKITWLVTDSRLNFVQDKAEWTNTRISFEIVPQADGTQLRFTHHGLTPAVECFDACSNAWSGYIADSLQNFIASGKGEPAVAE